MCWPRLRQLLASDREFLAFRAQLENEALRWREEGRGASWLLSGGRQLAEAGHWLSERRGDLGELEIHYAEVSLEAARQTLSRSDLLAGLRHLAAGRTEGDLARHDADARLMAIGSRSNEAIAGLSRAVQVDPRNRAAIFRLVTLLTQRTWALPVVGPTSFGGDLSRDCLTPDGRGLLTLRADGSAQRIDLVTHPPYGPVFRGGAPIRKAWFIPRRNRLVTLSSANVFLIREAAR